MDAWSAAAVSLASASAAANVLNRAVHSLQPLSSTFQEMLSGGSVGASDGEAGVAEAKTSPDTEISSLESIANEIRERVESILGLANLPIPKTNQLELSPLGNVYIEGQIEDQGDVEARLDADPTLKDLLEKWSRVSGGLPFQL